MIWRAPLVLLSLAAAHCPASAGPPATPDRIVIVIEENHSFQQVIGSPEAPFLNALAQSGASFVECYALTHPSQPNYLHLFSGAHQGVFDNAIPAETPFSTPNLAASLLASGATFVGYSEGLPEVGSNVESSGAYVRKHNPWVNWQSSVPGPNQLSPELNRPFTDFPTDFSSLPRVSVVVPNLDNDMHDGTIAQADAWLAQNIGPYAQWATTHNSLLIIAWDEDESASRNRIPMIFHGPMVRASTPAGVWTLHNLLRTLTDLHAAEPPGASAKVRPIFEGVFKGRPRTATRTFRAGVNGYAGARDTFIESAAPAAQHGADGVLVVDGSPLRQALIAFDALIGAGPDQVPPGSRIVSAKLLALTGPSSSSADASATVVSAHRMLVPWTAAATWAGLAAGVSPDDSEAAATSSFALTPNVLDAWAIFDVTSDVQLWSDALAPNHGWALLPGGTDGWRWLSSEAPVPNDRPWLQVTFETGPPCDADLDADGSVGSADLAALLGAWGAGPANADLNADGVVNSADLAAMLGAWGPCAQPR